MKHSIKMKFFRGIALLLVLGACQTPDVQQDQQTAHSRPLPASDSLVPEKASAQSSQEAAPTPDSSNGLFVLNIHGAFLETSPDGKTIDTLPQNLKVAVIDSNQGWYQIDNGGREGWLRADDLFASPLPEAEALDKLSDSLIYTRYFSGIGPLQEYQEPYFQEYTITGSDLSLEKAYQIIKYFFDAEERKILPRYLPTTEVSEQVDRLYMDMTLRPDRKKNLAEIIFNYAGGVTKGKVGASDKGMIIRWSYSAD